MITNTCLHCGKPFTAKHRNTDYCPEENCAYEAKLLRQNKNYEIGDNAKKAIQKNYKLILQLLGSTERGVFDLMYLLKLGFDQNGYYGSGITKTTEKKVMILHDYYFHITNDNPQKIEIWKMPKK